MKIFERKQFDVKGRVLSKDDFRLARDVKEYKIDPSRLVKVMEKADKYLDAPIVRLGAKHCPLAFNLGLENAIVPQISDIVEACKAVLYK